MHAFLYAVEAMKKSMHFIDHASKEVIEKLNTELLEKQAKMEQQGKELLEKQAKIE